MIVTLAFVALMVLLFLRTPIAVATGLVGLAGLAYFQGWGAAFSQVGIIASETVLTYEFAVIPLFIVMGAFIAHSGIAEELFRACYALVGHWRARGSIRRFGAALRSIRSRPCAITTYICRTRSTSKSKRPKPCVRAWWSMSAAKPAAGHGCYTCNWL